MWSQFLLRKKLAINFARWKTCITYLFIISHISRRNKIYILIILSVALWDIIPELIAQSAKLLWDYVYVWGFSDYTSEVLCAHRSYPISQLRRLPLRLRHRFSPYFPSTFVPLSRPYRDQCLRDKWISQRWIMHIFIVLIHIATRFANVFPDFSITEISWHKI